MGQGEHMKTNYQLPVSELTQAGAFFANLGLDCPWVGEDAWCDLKAKLVQGELLMEYDHDEGKSGGRQVYCPPAVAAAVVWFAGEVEAWWNLRNKDSRSAFIEASDPGLFYCYVQGGVMLTEASSRLEAAAALILGVWQAMGGE